MMEVVEFCHVSVTRERRNFSFGADYLHRGFALNVINTYIPLSGLASGMPYRGVPPVSPFESFLVR